MRTWVGYVCASCGEFTYRLGELWFAGCRVCGDCLAIYDALTRAADTIAERLDSVQEPPDPDSAVLEDWRMGVGES